MPRRPLVLGTAALLLLGACASQEEDAPSVPEEDELLESPSEEPDGSVPGADATADPGEQTPGAGCETLPTDIDGDYAAYDAGTAQVIFDGEALSLEEVEAAEGWEHEVTTEQDDEVEILFTGGGDDVELRVTLGEDLQAQAEACTTS